MHALGDTLQATAVVTVNSHHTSDAMLQEYVAAVSSDQMAAAEKSAQLMSATGGAPAGVGSEYVIEPPSTLAAEESDDGSDEGDDDMPLDTQVWCSAVGVFLYRLCVM